MWSLPPCGPMCKWLNVAHVTSVRSFGSESPRRSVLGARCSLFPRKKPAIFGSPSVHHQYSTPSTQHSRCFSSVLRKGPHTPELDDLLLSRSVAVHLQRGALQAGKAGSQTAGHLILFGVATPLNLHCCRWASTRSPKSRLCRLRLTFTKGLHRIVFQFHLIGRPKCWRTLLDCGVGTCASKQYQLEMRITGHGVKTVTMNSNYPKEGSMVANNLGMRRSCCECGRKKRKCDGLIPCSRCRGAGIQCTYSKRKPHQRQPQSQHRRRGPTSMQSTELLRHPSSGALLACGMLPLKRFRWSASPATGLVGMQENACLSDFFGCIGFMPLTTRSHIRGAMVRMMAISTPHHQPGAPHDSPGQGQFGSIFTEDGITTGTQLSTGPSACTFWCAVGLGALVKGSPVESVANYSRLGSDALDAYTGPVDAEMAKAWAILGYLYGFMGDMGKFEEYLELSDTFLTAAIEQGSTDMLPAGFAEIVNHKQTVKVYSGNAGPTDIEPLAARRQHPPQVNPVVSEEDVFQYVSQSLVAFEQVVFEKVSEKRSTCGQRSDNEPCLENRAGASPHGNVIQAEEVSDAMVAGLKDGLIEFEHLQETVDRPNICCGVGGLLINIPLAYSKAANGDASGTLERFGHCVEVFERYPGVCRCMMNWCHLAHGTLGALAAIDDSRARGLYNRLRDVYNSSRHPSSLPAPPLEEWRGISAICDHFQCRLTEGVIASQAVSVFSTPPYCSSNCVGPQTTCKQEDSQIVVKKHHDIMVSAGVIPENATGEMMAAPNSNGDKPMTSTSWWELNQEPAPQTSPPAGPSLFADLHGELVRGGASDTEVYGGAVEGCGGGVVSGLAGQVPDMSLTSPLLGDVDGGTEKIGDDTIAAADWLEVTHAMLDATDVNPVP